MKNEKPPSWVPLARELTQPIVEHLSPDAFDALMKRIAEAVVVGPPPSARLHTRVSH